MSDKSDLKSLESHGTVSKAEREKEPQLAIRFNKWGTLFMFLFVATLGYLILAPLIYIPPFEFNTTLNEYVINDLLLTILGILGLIFLGLGIYFGWFRKEKEPEASEKSMKERDAAVAEVDQDNDQIMFTYIEEDEAEHEQLLKEADE